MKCVCVCACVCLCVSVYDSEAASVEIKSRVYNRKNGSKVKEVYLQLGFFILSSLHLLEK